MPVFMFDVNEYDPAKPFAVVRAWTEKREFAHMASWSVREVVE